MPYPSYDERYMKCVHRPILLHFQALWQLHQIQRTREKQRYTLATSDPADISWRKSISERL